MTQLNFTKLFYVFALLFSFVLCTSAQVVYQYGFENLPGNGNTAASPWTGIPDVLATGLSNSSWATNYASGFISYDGSCGNSSCQALSISGNNEPSATTYTLAFTVNSNYTLAITGISFWDRESGTGPNKMNITINGTSAISNLTLAGTTGANTGTLTPAGTFNNLTGTVTVVLSLSGASGASGTFRLDDFIIDGTVTSSSSTVFNVTGGGAFCAGGTGVLIGLSGSQTGFTYQLVNGATNTGAPIAGTGNAISFGNIDTPGTYTVVGTDTSTSAATNMNGSAVITIDAGPVVANMASASCWASDTLDAGNAGSRFVWSNSDTTETDIVTASGTYAVTVTDNNGCSARGVDTVTFGATLPVMATPTQNPICPGSSVDITASGGTDYIWNNSNTTATINVSPSSATLYSVTASNSTGCSGTASVNITVLSISGSTVSQYICNGQSYNGHTASGNYTDTLTSVNGCDSIVSLTLTVSSNSITPVNQTICAGQVYNGHTASGNYNDTLLTAHGCDSIVSLTLNVLSQITSNSFQTICAGESYNGHTATGVYVDTLVTSGGCDSIVTTQLLVSSLITSSTTQTLCAGQTYNGHGATGTYTDTLQTAGGCDSVVTLQLTVTAPITSSVSQTICAGQSYGGHGSTGTFIDTLSSGSGCDSIRTLNLTVTAPVTSSTSQTVCSGQSVNGHSLTGTYSDTLFSGTGCDSVVDLNLTVLPSIINSINYSICHGDTFMGQTVTGTYNDTLTTVSGCDSVIILQLTVNALPHVTLYLTFDTVCSNGSPIAMSGGSPAGGLYSGQAINNGQFIPSLADIGEDTIYYTYTDSNGCTKSHYEYAYTEICTGIDPVALTAFTVSPNPTQGYISIESNNPNERYTAQLLDLTGNRIAQLSEKPFTGRTVIDMSSLSSGIYFLRIRHNNAVIRTEKIVKF